MWPTIDHKPLTPLTKFEDGLQLLYKVEENASNRLETTTTTALVKQEAQPSQRYRVMLYVM